MDLPLTISTPARYLGSEVNLPSKRLRKGMFRAVLAFADVYEVGMSHIGLKILYYILNEREDIYCERVFAPWTDMMRYMRERDIPLTSLETKTPLNCFDMIGFSLQYEMSYPTLLAMLKMGGVPIRSSERNVESPWVLAGGPCATNPEPLASFIDAFVIGDGERIVLEIADRLKQARESHERRDVTLEALAKIKGVYVPEFFDVTYNAQGRPVGIRNLKGNGPVHRRIEGDLNALPFPTREVVPIIRAVHDRYAVEIARGCLQGCRFCQAGFTYRPYRERDLSEILHFLKEGLGETGYNECSFLSLSAGDFSRISTLLEVAVESNLSSDVSISLPSLRISSLTPEMIKTIRKTGFTLAPEAGTQRLRDVINKKIDEDEILSTIEKIFKAGGHIVKLYFMIGLPTEQKGDMEGIVTLVTKAWRMARKISRKNNITISISNFVPKPHTPFQWCAMASMEEILEKQIYLRRRLSRRGMRVKWHDAHLSFWEGVISRGGRPLGEFIYRVAREGAYLDGWTEQFSKEVWDSIASNFSPSLIESGLGAWDSGALFPWDVVDIGVKKDYLWEEYRRAIDAVLTPACPTGSCRRCGVCDEEHDVTVTLSRTKRMAPVEVEWENLVKPTQGPKGFLHATYIKIRDARFLGHLDTARAVLMAARRSGLPMIYSKGFHPAPRVRFSAPIPLGMESLNEVVEFALSRLIDPNEAKISMNAYLPRGIRLTKVRTGTLKSMEGFDNINMYSYICLFRIFNSDEAERIMNLAREVSLGKIVTVSYPTKEGILALALADYLIIEGIHQTHRWVRLDVQVGGLPKGVRVMPLIAILFGVSDGMGKEMRMIKLGNASQSFGTYDKVLCDE